jgi:hypothetical protein
MLLKASPINANLTNSDLCNHSQGNASDIVQQFTLGWRYEAAVRAKKSRIVVTTERLIVNRKELGERTAYSHSGRRPSWARISRIVRPVCWHSSCTNSVILFSRDRASLESVIDR